MSNNVAQRGVNPITGGSAFRDIAYRALRNRPGQVFSSGQIASLSGLPIKQAIPALNGLNTKNYPFVHRVGRGQYVYDATKPERIWKHFTQMKRPQSRKSDVRRVASLVAGAPRFVETFPVFERGSQGITMTPDAFVLKDDKGNLWQATKV
jgi:hypothetical protein